MTEKRIIGVSSLSTTHQVGLNTMKSILGSRLSLVPTVLIAGVATSTNAHVQTLPIYEILESTIEDALSKKQQIIIYTGYFKSPNQIQEVVDIYQKYKSNIDKIYVDPICGDHGEKYQSEEVISALNELLSIADYACPNETELELLLQKGGLEENIKHWRATYNGTLILTSVQQQRQIGSIVMDGEDQFFIGNTIFDGNYIGTGDAFSSLFLYFKEIQQLSLYKAVKNASQIVTEIIKESFIQEKVELEINNKWENYFTSSALQVQERTP